LRTGILISIELDFSKGYLHWIIGEIPSKKRLDNYSGWRKKVKLTGPLLELGGRIG